MANWKSCKWAKSTHPTHGFRNIRPNSVLNILPSNKRMFMDFVSCKFLDPGSFSSPDPLFNPSYPTTKSWTQTLNLVSLPPFPISLILPSTPLFLYPNLFPTTKIYQLKIESVHVVTSTKFIAKLSFNLNLNLVGSWISATLQKSSRTPILRATHLKPSKSEPEFGTTAQQLALFYFAFWPSFFP